jgi:P27 family predicted phage terminase small subunit
MAKKKPIDLNPAPEHLQAETRDWFASVVTEFELEPHHVRILTLAAEAWDRTQEARAALATHGITYTDRFGAPRCRPEVAVERDSRIAFTRCVRELGLDLAPPSDSRPPRIGGRD